MPDNVKSAKFGSVSWTNSGDTTTAVPDIRNIQFSRDPDLKDYGSSDTNGKTGRHTGREDLTGSFECYVAKDDDLPFAEGDRGTIDITNDGSTLMLDGESVRIGKIDRTVSVEDADTIVFACEFAQDASAA